MEENLRDLPQRQGMYDPANEHDACGVGFIVNIKGERSYDIVYDALDILENLKHRGGEGADHKSGDGAGIMVQIPPCLPEPGMCCAGIPTAAGRPVWGRDDLRPSIRCFLGETERSL